MSKFCTMFEKNNAESLHFLSQMNCVLIPKKGFTVFQKSLLSITPFSFKY